MTPAQLKLLKRCVEIISGYRIFHEGQDGFQALVELQRLTGEITNDIAPYGFCPHCAAPGVSRERRPDGNDQCKSGHIYPTRAAR